MAKIEKKRSYHSFDPQKGYPASKNLYYECTKCGDVISSLPADSISCTCRNIHIDVEYGRVAINDHRFMKVFSEEDNIMKYPLPEKIHCRITKEGHPVQGLTIYASLETNYKNNYGFIIGPTGQDGYAELNREEIIAMAEEELNLSLMDYGKIDEVFIGTINVQIMTKDEIEGAIRAYNIYKDVSKTFPRDYEKDLKNAASIISQVEVNKLKLDAFVEPSQIRMVINPVGHKIEPLKYKGTASK